MPSYYSILILLVLAWGTFAFGAVYEWAYVPLFWACAAVGALGLLSPGARQRARVAWPVLAGLALVAAAIGVQLIPLPAATVARVSPATDRFLVEKVVGYEAARSLVASFRHPLSIDPAGTWLALSCLAALAVLLVGVTRGLGRRSVRTLAAGLVVSGAILALAGVVQSGLWARSTREARLIYGFWKPIYGTNPFGPFVNHNHFAGWMLLGLPVATGYFCALVARGMRGVKPTFRERVLWLSSPDASRVILVGLAVVVMAISLVLTLSRSGISGFLLALAISGWFVIRRQGEGPKRAIAGGYLVLLATLSVGWVGFDKVAGQFTDAKGTGFNGRFAIWADTMKVVRDFPLAGTGVGTYAASMGKYQEYDMTTRTAEAHNDYLQLVAEGGVLLAVPVLAALFLLARENSASRCPASRSSLPSWPRSPFTGRKPRAGRRSGRPEPSARAPQGGQWEVRRAVPQGPDPEAAAPLPCLRLARLGRGIPADGRARTGGARPGHARLRRHRRRPPAR